MNNKGRVVIIVFAVLSALNFTEHASAAHSRLIAMISQQDTPSTKQLAQNNAPAESLDELAAKAGSKMIPLETADAMLRDIRSMSLNNLNDEQADKLMKVYRSISNSYAENFRFK